VQQMLHNAPKKLAIFQKILLGFSINIVTYFFLLFTPIANKILFFGYDSDLTKNIIFLVEQILQKICIKSWVYVIFAF